MQIGKWHQELDMFLNIKTTFILEGNVYDMYSYPTKLEDGSERWDMVMLDKYLNSYFHDHGYENILYFNHIDGFYDPFKGQKSRSGDLFTSDGITIREGMGRQNMTEAGTAIRAVLENRGRPAVIIMMLASRYVLSADNVSENERDFYSKLMLASLKKTQARNGDKGFLNNLLVLVTEKANDVPAWFYLDNPLEKTMMLNKPDKAARRMFIDTQLQYFLKADSGYSEDEIEKMKETFCDLTEGMRNLDLNALRIFCANEELDLSEIRQAINMFKYGVKTNPWAEIPEDRLEHAEEFIRRRVKGQTAAVSQAVDVIKRAACNMAGIQHSSGSKPKGILFFAGPTGTGKTELAKTLAELLFSDENACIRFDMSEYQQPQADQKLLGAPPGYVGYEAGGQLTNAIREHPFSILLFDEIEKAHPSIFDKFLQILEDGRMTDGKGETVYFSESIIIFTSNLGIYTTDSLGQRHLNVDQNMPYEEMKERLINSIKDYFKLELGRPEILNRIGDNFVVFDFIRQDVAKEIMDAQISKIIRNVKEQKHIDLEVSDEAHAFLQEKAFGNLENGGRGIGNIMEKYFINPLARYIYDHHMNDGSIRVEKIVIENDIVNIVCGN